MGDSDTGAKGFAMDRGLVDLCSRHGQLGHLRSQINDPVAGLKRAIRFENNLGRKM